MTLQTLSRRSGLLALCVASSLTALTGSPSLFAQKAVAVSTSPVSTLASSLQISSPTATAAASYAIPAQFRAPSARLITEPVETTRTVQVPGAVNPDVKRSRDLGEVNGDLALGHIQLILRRPEQRQAALDAFVDALHDPRSPSFQKWLTPEQIGEEFGPASADIAAVQIYLQHEGFTVNRAGKAGTYLDFSGTAAQVQRSFHTSIHYLRTPENETHYSAVQEASLPAALTPLVVGFVSLSDIPAHSLLRKAVRPQVTPNAGITPRDTGGSDYNVGPQDFYTIYDENSILTANVTGSGQTVALLEETDVLASDVTTFRSTFAVPSGGSFLQVNGSTSVPCTDPGHPTSPVSAEEVEGIVDAEWASAVAPGAKILYVSCSSNGTQGIFLSAEAVIDDMLAPVMSLSYGGSEIGQSGFSTFVSNLWEQATAQGQTVVVSSGDSGSDVADDHGSIATNGINVNVLGSTAYNVSAGGTDFQDLYNDNEGDSSYNIPHYWNSSNGTGLSSAKSYIAETAWNDTCASPIVAILLGYSSPNTACDSGNYTALGGGSGGPSVLVSRPSWQTGTVYGLPSTSAYSGRLLPDISFFASNGIFLHALAFYQSDTSSSVQFAGGTSFVAPQMAAMFSLIVQKYGERLGQPDYVLYNMGGVAYGTTSFTGGTACNGSGTTSNTGLTSSSPGSACIFRDVTTSNNSQACTKGTANCYSDGTSNNGILSTSTTSAAPAFASGLGYDMATGLGSVDITNLVNNWKTAASGGATYTPTVMAASTAGSYTYGSPSSITFSATVSGSGGFPTGNVTFSGTSPINTIATAPTVESGCSQGNTCVETASTSYTPSATLTAGIYSITAAYLSTNENYTSGSGSVPLVVNKAQPTVTVNTVSVPPASSTTLTASLSYPGSGAAPTVSISFKVDSGTTVTGACTGSSSPLSCSATYNTSALSTGAHTITVTNQPGTNYLTATNTGTLNITASPTIAEGFSLSPVAPGSPTTVTLTLGNPSANTVSLTGVAFTDTLPSGLLVSTNPGASTTCTGGSLIAVAGSGSISLSGATIAAGQTCTVQVKVSAANSGTYTNTTGQVTATNASAGGTASATLTVAATRTITVISPTVRTGATAYITAYIDSGTTYPTGTVTMLVNGSSANVGPITCVNKALHLNCTATYNAVGVAPGNFTLLVTQVADANYPAASGTGFVTVTP